VAYNVPRLQYTQTIYSLLVRGRCATGLIFGGAKTASDPMSCQCQVLNVEWFDSIENSGFLNCDDLLILFNVDDAWSFHAADGDEIR